jgi:hypothetical protein
MPRKHVTHRSGSRASQGLPATPPGRNPGTANTDAVDPLTGLTRKELALRRVMYTMSDKCAWCFKTMADDAPAILVYAELTSTDQFWRERMITPVFVAGQFRHAWVNPPAEPDALDGRNVMFTFCSETCATALEAAVRREGLDGTLH